MGCGASVPQKVTLNVKLERSDLEIINKLYQEIEEIIDNVNKINSGLSVAIDKFQTVTGLHEPPRSLGCGVVAMLSCLLLYSDCDLRSLNFHFLDCVPGFNIDTSVLPGEVGNIYQIWVALNKEVEASVEDFQALMPSFQKAVLTYNHFTQENREAVTPNNQEKLIESSEFFGSLLHKITNCMEELNSIQLGLRNAMPEVIKIAQHARHKGLFWPSEIMKAVGFYIEIVAKKFMLSIN